ncbi:hypothetical protein F4859DRAFT_82510 [Xylaria cf. heliscus]|nr:hypothetical protein F4859DRAFT_82510 [Xylaria cf. heliscus]
MTYIVESVAGWGLFVGSLFGDRYCTRGFQGIPNTNAAPTLGLRLCVAGTYICMCSAYIFYSTVCRYLLGSKYCRLEVELGPVTPAPLFCLDQDTARAGSR